MKKIISYFKQFIGIKQPIDTNSSTINYNELIIRVTSEGRIFVNFDINNFSQSDCDNFATMLYYMNEGHYVQTILDLFLYFAKEDPKYVNFMDKVLRKWSGLVDNIKDDYGLKDDAPIIAPSAFYKLTGHTK